MATGFPVAVVERALTDSLVVSDLCSVLETFTQGMVGLRRYKRDEWLPFNLAKCFLSVALGGQRVIDTATNYQPALLPPASGHVGCRWYRRELGPQEGKPGGIHPFTAVYTELGVTGPIHHSLYPHISTLFASA